MCREVEKKARECAHNYSFMASFSQIKKGKRYHLKTLGHGLQEYLMIKIQVCAWYSKYDLACLVAIVMVSYLEEGDPILTNIDIDKH